MQSLYQKYRPESFAQVIGQSRALQQVRSSLARGWGGRAFWITGSSGTGKTSLARIIASQGADEFFVEEYDSPAALMLADTANHIESSMHFTAWGKGGRAFIINEAHGLRKPEIRWLLGVLERIPPHVVFIFTTTKDSGALFCDFQTDALPLLSRCQVIELADNHYVARAFAKACKKIAQIEKLDGRPLADYVTLAKDCKTNFRAILQRIEAGQMKGR